MSDEIFRAFKASLAMEAIADVGHRIEVQTYKSHYYRKVTYREQIPPFQVLDIGAIAAQTVSPRTNAGNLDLQDNEFGQWRWFPLDARAMVRIFNPTGVSRHQLKFLQIGVEKSIIYRDPLLLSTEFNSWEDERPAFEGMNFSDYALNACRIEIFGYRFITEDIPATEYCIIEGPQRGLSVTDVQPDPGDSYGPSRGLVATSKDAITVNGRLPRVVKTLDALRMKLIPCTLVVCAGSPAST